MVTAKNTVRYLLLAAGMGLLVFGGAFKPTLAASVPIVATPKEDTDDEDKPKPPPKPTYVRNYTTPASAQTPRSTSIASTTPTTAPLSTASAPIHGPITQRTTSTPETKTGTTQPAATTTAPAATTGSATQAASTPERPINPAIMPLLLKAYDYMRKGRFDGAVAELSTAVRTDPSSVAARRYLAFTLLKMNAPLDAIQQLGLIARMTKPTTFDYYSLGEAYYTLGDYKQAFENYSQAQETNQSYDAARGGRIKSLAMMGQYTDAFRLCLEGIRRARDAKSQNYYRQLYALVSAEKTTPTQPSVIDLTAGTGAVGNSGGGAQWTTLPGATTTPAPVQQH